MGKKFHTISACSESKYDVMGVPCTFGVDHKGIDTHSGLVHSQKQLFSYLHIGCIGVRWESDMKFSGNTFQLVGLQPNINRMLYY